MYSVNGSTGAILASVRTATKCARGAKVIVSRAVHKSVYHALELCGVVPYYIAPRLATAGFCTSVTSEEVSYALEKCPDASLVIVTSPTYEGVISDIRGIASVCHEHGVPLMVDEAHGAHLGLYDIFPDGAVKCGADIVVQSFHKTLPSLTQTAAVHQQGTLVNANELGRQMAIFQTSSPSYILSASIDGAVRYLASDEGKERLEEWYVAVTETRNRLQITAKLKLYTGDENVFQLDKSKLVILGDGFGIMKALREEYNIELEMASVGYAVAMTGAGDVAESLDRFASAVESIGEVPFASEIYKGNIHIPKAAYLISDAVCMKRETVSLKNAAGRVSASYIYAYPPGIPLVVPGEVIDFEVVTEIEGLAKAGASVRGIKHGKIMILK